MFIEALFRRAKTRKQPKCPSKEGWTKMMCQRHRGIVLGHEKCNHALCSNRDGPRDYPNSEAAKRRIIYHLSMESKKKKPIQMNLFIKQKASHRENKLIMTEAGTGKGYVKNLGIKRHTLLYIKYKINKNLLDRTVTSTRYSVISYTRKEYIKKVYKCLRMIQFVCTAETNTAFQISDVLITLKY